MLLLFGAAIARDNFCLSGTQPPEAGAAIRTSESGLVETNSVSNDDIAGTVDCVDLSRDSAFAHLLSPNADYGRTCRQVRIATAVERFNKAPSAPPLKDSRVNKFAFSRNGDG